METPKVDRRAPGASRVGQAGFTLLELMVALGSSMVLLLAILAAVKVPTVGYNTNRTINEMNQNGRVALDVIANDLIMSGSGTIFTYSLDSDLCSRAAGMIFADKDNPTQSGDGGGADPDQITLVGAPHGSSGMVATDNGSSAAQITYQALDGASKPFSGLDAAGQPWDISSRNPYQPAISKADVDLNYHLLFRGKAAGAPSYKMVRLKGDVTYSDPTELVPNVTYEYQASDVFNSVMGLMGLAGLGGASYQVPSCDALGGKSKDCSWASVVFYRTYYIDQTDPDHPMLMLDRHENPPNPIQVASDIADLQFEFYQVDPGPSVPVLYTYSTSDRTIAESIRYVKVSVLARSSSEDSTRLKNSTFVKFSQPLQVANRIWGGSDNYRYRIFDTTVQVRSSLAITSAAAP